VSFAEPCRSDAASVNRALRGRGFGHTSLSSRRNDVLLPASDRSGTLSPGERLGGGRLPSSRPHLFEETDEGARARAERPAFIVDHVKVPPDLQLVHRDDTQSLCPNFVLDGIS